MKQQEMSSAVESAMQILEMAGIKPRIGVLYGTVKDKSIFISLDGYTEKEYNKTNEGEINNGHI